MHATDKFDEPLELNLGDTAAPVRFETPQEAVDWMRGERDYWDVLRRKVSQAFTIDPAAQNAFSQVKQRLVGLLGPMEALQDARPDQYYNALVSYANLVKSRSLFATKGRIGIAVDGIAKSDPDMALRAALAYCSPSLQLQAQTLLTWIRAGALAEAIDKGFTDTGPTLNELLGRMLDEWSGRYRSVELEQQKRLTDLSDLTERMATTADRFGSDVQEAKARNDELRADLDTKTATAIADGDARVTAIVETYNARMALEAPTTYWKQKRNGHRIAVAAWSAGFVATLVAATLGVWSVWDRTVFPLLDFAEKHNSPLPNYGFYLPTVAAAFLAVWVLRLFSRQILSNLALSSDAGERVAMVMTFLALMQKPEHVKEADRILILGSLFRPALQVQDDGAPPHWFDLVMERIKPSA